MCNLAQIASLAAAGTVDSAKLFHMTAKELELVSKDRTWLASVPIFDPFDSAFRAREGPVINEVFGVYFHQMTNVLDGPVLGVVNIDANWDYATLNLDSDPMKHCADERVIMVMEMMQQASLRLGQILGASLPSRKEIS